MTSPDIERPSNFHRPLGTQHEINNKKYRNIASCAVFTHRSNKGNSGVSGRRTRWEDKPRRSHAERRCFHIKSWTQNPATCSHRAYAARRQDARHVLKATRSVVHIFNTNKLNSPEKMAAGPNWFMVKFPAGTSCVSTCATPCVCIVCGTTGKAGFRAKCIITAVG